MNVTQLWSIIFLIIGIIISSVGLLFYWQGNAPYGWNSFVIITGFLFLFAAIILLCISFSY